MRALLVIDMLNDFVLDDGALPIPQAKKIVPRINELIGEFRGQGEPILFLGDAHAKDDEEFRCWPPHCVKGSRGAELFEGIDRKNEPLVETTRYSGFFGADLDDRLRTLGVDTLYLAGVATDICILWTAADAYLRGYRIVIPRDAVSGVTPERHEAALRYMHETMGASIV
jgi:nicotinamidase-related amidase